jgi:hypothetical protein
MATIHILWHATCTFRAEDLADFSKETSFHAAMECPLIHRAAFAIGAKKLDAHATT